MTSLPPHPLQALTEDEFRRARDAVVKSHTSNDSLYFRSIYLYEPDKVHLIPFLQAEHAGTLDSSTPRPPRQARVEYDSHSSDSHEFIRSVVDITDSTTPGQVVSKNVAPKERIPYICTPEFVDFMTSCMESEMVKEALTEFELPEGFTITMDPWPYGGPDADGEPHYMQGLMFAQNPSSATNPDANHYTYPLPIIPIMNWVTREVVRIDRLATGGTGDSLDALPRVTNTQTKLFHDSVPAEYVPELLSSPIRQDLKPLNVVQPEGASFTVHPDNLITWQKWRFRLGFTPREGAVLHDITYENRPVMYRLSYSELTVPYGDPRPPFHRKQAFDFGDVGVGRGANNLQLGCDCLGAIHYFDNLDPSPEGEPTLSRSVVCLHEQDNGILWKHTNFRTDRAIVTRNRELVIQYIITLANYEYIFIYKLDLAGSITVETRATGVMSVVGIDKDKTSPYGNVVGPGIMAQNHQHIFAVRIDPAIDSYTGGQVVVEESVPHPMNPTTNPFGNMYEIQRQLIERPRWVDAEPRLNRTLKLESSEKKNPISGKNVGYKILAPATQLLLADDESTVARRARFAKHNFWVTGYRDNELYAAGEFTNQSRNEEGGVSDMIKRADWFTAAAAAEEEGVEKEGKQSSPVVWSVFGFTHNPRIEDWPVMPVEIHQMHLRPVDFFTANPALDVPSKKNDSSVLLSSSCCSKKDADKEKEKEKEENDGDKVDSKISKRLSRAFSDIFRGKEKV